MTGFNSKRQAAQPQAEPVAWRRYNRAVGWQYEDGITSFAVDPSADPLYTHPAAPVPAVQSAARAIADEQSYDTGLWFVANTVTEAHLQAALRRLAAAVEGEAPVARAPLTDEEIWGTGSKLPLSKEGIIDFVRALEAKLKEKNSDRR
jgi:hypothetical protein